MRVEFALRVKARVLADSGHVCMTDWLFVAPRNFNKSALSCGTAGCIAGQCLIEEYGLKGALEFSLNVEDEAARLLGLRLTQAHWLFMFHCAPTGDPLYGSLSDELSEFKAGTPEYAAVVARAIDRCIELVELEGS